MLIENHSERIRRSEANKSKALHFLFDETWSTAPVLEIVLGLSTSATYKTLARLEKQYLLRRQMIRELGTSIWGITHTGVAEAWEYGAPIEKRATFEPSKVNPLFVAHHIDLQRARLLAEKHGWTEWKPDKLLPKGLRKRPDATVLSPKDNRVAVEYERTIKSHKRYEAIWSSYLMDIRNGLYHFVYYVVPDSKTKRSLERIFSLIECVPVNGQRIKLEDKHRARFQVFEINQWPNLATGL